MRQLISAFIFTMTILCVCGCDKDTNQSRPLPITVEGDKTVKAVLEEQLKANPNIYIPRKNVSIPGPTTNYSIQIIKPDPNKEYSILRIEPDPNTEYSMIIIDPRTQKPPSNIDPNALDAILKELKKRQESTDK